MSQLAAAHTDACTLVTYSAIAISWALGKRLAPKIHIKPGHNNPYPISASWVQTLASPYRKLRLINLHNIYILSQQQNVARRGYRSGGMELASCDTTFSSE
jgi:hypothetical protein